MMRPQLFQVVPTDEYQVYLYFDNGEIRRYDCRWVQSEAGVFERLHDLATFKNKRTVMNGTLAWDLSGTRDPYSCTDLCPDTIYRESVPDRDPLTRSA